MSRLQLTALVSFSALALASISGCALEEDAADGVRSSDTVGNADTANTAASGEVAQSLAALAPVLTEVTGFGSNPGALKMFRYVPAGLPAGSPLVVALHGCTQNALTYATHTEWNTLADRYRFAVIYAEQQRANNSSFCFSWFQTSDTSRGQGEALSIKQMVDTIKSSHGVDPSRVFVNGLSAGGFMTASMMATYPDVFAGGAINAGGPHACAASIIDASPCQRGTVSRTPQQWGDLVRGAFSGYAGPYPRMIAFHGASDATVAPADMQQAVDQWSNALRIDNAADLTETFRTSTHKVYRDGGGRSMIETYLIASTGHALMVDPGTGVDQGGATGAYSEDKNLYSSYYIAKFWGLIDGPPPGGDTTPPQVSVTAPAAGSTVSGTITVTFDASDNTGVSRVELLVDGAALGSDSAAPYAIALDTRALANGNHVLGARAFDAAGNQASAATRTINVQNTGGGGGARLETFSAAGGADQSGWTFGAWALTTAKDATGTSGSRSLTATAAPAFNTVTQTATWTGIALGAAPKLSYQRQLALSNANIMASSAFTVIINDGSDHVVDTRALSGWGSYNEAAWTARANLDLSAYAGRTVTLKLVVTANDPGSTVTRAQAWIDQIQFQ